MRENSEWKYFTRTVSDHPKTSKVFLITHVKKKHLRGKRHSFHFPYFFISSILSIKKIPSFNQDNILVLVRHWLLMSITTFSTFRHIPRDVSNRLWAWRCSRQVAGRRDRAAGPWHSRYRQHWTLYYAE